MFVPKKIQEIPKSLLQKEEKHDVEDSNALSLDQIDICLKNVMNPESWEQAITMLNSYLEHYKLNFCLYDSVVDLLYRVKNSIQNNFFQNQHHLDSIINLFYNMVYEDNEMADLLISEKIHKIFFPFIQRQVSLKLFIELLILDRSPKNLNSKANLPHDHDQYQEAYEQICVKKGYNSVAHYCVANGIAQKLLEILNTDLKDEVLHIIEYFGKYYFSFESFVPVFGPILQIIYQEKDLQIKSHAIDSISSFAGSSRKSQQFFLNISEFQKLFIDYPIESPEIFNSILLCAKSIMHICEYLSDESSLTFLNFAIRALQMNDPNLLDLSIEVISEGTKKGELYALYCMNSGIIQQLFQIFESGINSFKTQTKLFIAICYFFDSSNFECSKQMVNLGFFQLISEHFEPMSYDNSEVMQAVLDALQHALRLASKNPSIAEWYSLIFDDEQIMKPIEDLDSCENIASEESLVYYVHSFLADPYYQNR